MSKRIEYFTDVHDIRTMAALLMIYGKTQLGCILYIYILISHGWIGNIHKSLLYRDTNNNLSSSLFAISSFWFQPFSSFSRAQKAPKTLVCLARRHGDSWELDSTPLCNLPATPNWQKTIENVDSQKITFRPKYVNVFRRFFSCVVFWLVIVAGLMDSKSEVLGGWWNVIVTRICYY